MFKNRDVHVLYIYRYTYTFLFFVFGWFFFCCLLLLIQKFKLVQIWRHFSENISYPLVFPNSNFTIGKTQFGVYRKRKDSNSQQFPSFGK